MFLITQVFQSFGFQKSTKKNKQNDTAKRFMDEFECFCPSPSKPGDSTEIAIQCPVPLQFTVLCACLI